MTRARRRRRYWARRQARKRPRGFSSTDYFAPPYAPPAGGSGPFHCATLLRLPGDAISPMTSKTPQPTPKFGDAG